MSSLVVAIPNDAELAGEIGKKGSENGITFYNRNVDGEAIVILAPTDPASKFYALAEAILISDMVVISTARMDWLLGESLIAASLLGKRTIFTKENDVSRMLASMPPAQHEFLERKSVLGRLAEFKRDPKQAAEELRVDIDKSFPVKGVGTVLLGIVRAGTVRVHDTLHSSLGKEIPVRSIQVHDNDSKEAAAGERVGLAVKGIDHSEIEKGEILSMKGRPRLTSFGAELRMSPLLKDKPAYEGAINCMLVSGFSASNCKVSGNVERVSIRLDKPVALWKGDSFLLIREKSPRVFAAGIVGDPE